MMPVFLLTLSNDCLVNKRKFRAHTAVWEWMVTGNHASNDIGLKKINCPGDDNWTLIQRTIQTSDWIRGCIDGNIG
jgi:hypothetical protein